MSLLGQVFDAENKGSKRNIDYRAYLPQSPETKFETPCAVSSRSRSRSSVSVAIANAGILMGTCKMEKNVTVNHQISCGSIRRGDTDKAPDVESCNES